MSLGGLFMFIVAVLLILLILINAFFAASEIAFISLNDTKVKRMAEEGDHKSKKFLSYFGARSFSKYDSNRYYPCRFFCQCLCSGCIC